MPQIYYTLVQHSAVLTGHSDFLRAVEETSFTEKNLLAKIVRAGGLVFNNYGEAHARASQENYPPEVTGLVPKVRGRFSTISLDGQLLYIPPKESAHG